MKKLLLLALVTLALALPSFGQTAANSSTLGGELNGVRAHTNQYHITANTTINVAVSTARLYGAHVLVTNAGTTWAWTISAVSAGNQSLAAVVVGPWTAVTNSGIATNLLGSNPPANGYLMQGGINITFSGTAGVADLFLDYR